MTYHSVQDTRLDDARGGVCVGAGSFDRAD